jgi:hypothetical protein
MVLFFFKTRSRENSLRLSTLKSMYAFFSFREVHGVTAPMKFYFSMFIVYAVIGGVWAWQCYRNLQDLLPIQVRSKNVE